MEKHFSTIKNILLVFLLIAIAYLLKELAFVFVPLVFALFVTLLLYPLLRNLNKKGIPHLLSSGIVLFGAVVFIWMAVDIVGYSVKQIIEQQDEIHTDFQEKFGPVSYWINENLSMNEENAGELQSDTFQNVSPQAMIDGLQDLAKEIGSIASAALLFLVFLVVFMSGSKNIHKYIEYIAGNESKGKQAKETFERIVVSLSSFLKVKIAVSLLTAISFSIICWAFGVDFPIFWGFLAFLLNFIQMIGSLAVTVLLCAFGFLQIDSLVAFVAFAALLGGGQILIGSFVEPYLMGRKFSINMAAIVLSLVIWGYVWGIVGMLLSVPIMVLIVVVLQHNPNAAMIVRLLQKRPVK